MKRIWHKSIVFILCLSMFSSILSLSFVKADLSIANPGGLTETIVVFNHQSANAGSPAIKTITIKDLPIESCIMNLEARNGDTVYWRAIHFDVDGYLDGVVGTPPGVGGAILTYRQGPGQVRGPGVLYNVGSPSGPCQKSFEIDMSDECYFASSSGSGPDAKFYHNFIPQDPSHTIGYFSPGEHIITAFVTAPASTINTWVTVILHITYKLIPATVDFNPNTLNRKSQGNTVTVFIELPEGYDVNDIDVSTLMLNDVIPLDDNKKTQVGDHNDNGIPDLKVKFDRQTLIDLLEPGENVLITISGNLNNGLLFEGTDTIRVIH